ncbi:MAG TPA: peptidase U32 family protein, partial [Prevotella sp.]
MRQLELLAPAKNLECGIAAIDHGADAVYIGAARFGARAAAGNSIDDIAELCRYAHQYGAKVYVTINTIVYENELDDTRSLLLQLAQIEVDAVLVQDMAVLEIVAQLQQENPQLRMPALHASTQTDNRSAEKVAWLKSLGFERVVLARELSAAEIADIYRQVPHVDLEVFVHGALCVSYSGVCYASQHCFNRSANRGECAQFCRMKFDLVDSNGQIIEHQRHLLSLKDMSQIDNLETLADAGACSFKIEGRLKEVNYVKNVVSAYSRRLNEIVRKHPEKYCRASLGEVEYTFEPDLQKTFNRGYTTYFLNGRKPDIFSPDTPKALGEFVGHVKELRGNSFNVAGTAAFANGDGLCFINAERELEGFRVNRVEG